VEVAVELRKVTLPVDYDDVPADMRFPDPGPVPAAGSGLAKYMNSLPLPGAHLLKDLWADDEPVPLAVVAGGRKPLNPKVEMAARVYPPVMTSGFVQEHEQEIRVLLFLMPRLVAQVLDWYLSDPGDETVMICELPLSSARDLVTLARLWVVSEDEYIDRYQAETRYRLLAEASSTSGVPVPALLEVTLPLWDDADRGHEAFPGCVDTAVTLATTGGPSTV
jgi:hypothetical protein